ncbi:FdhF/YdeP family oxidoreductase [Rhizobium sp. WYJ-E13]|uniref:FdhF/YdeP family oxidoreductase n=1 Tax=Rhizobium sp. WYJ-E13 TaxID=2849093 RepID=UPI001C1F0759|nr:FdhF/YdeP family oxidoreductase [Rhizobium sp. WYJ-E13]QWW72570.1 FdhF/YdeP family oxidoreductase [Rhizobium sp. WYJ-E13]
MSSDTPPGIEPYEASAGGWGALRAVARTLKEQQVVFKGAATLLKANQPDGFDCPGCAWPDPDHTSAFEFCENGAKAITWESTKKRAGPDFFAHYPVSQLWTWSDHQLEDAGRLTHPMIYDHDSDRFIAIAWDDAFSKIASELRALADPNFAEFYTSGRASNEAAFLYQLFVRAYGTNNFPDCSNMCHEATSVGLPKSIGVGKGTVELVDFNHCDLIISIGHNPGTNHPRMMTTLHDASRRGVPILVFNPLRERALERFTAPQNPIEMLTNSATPIAAAYHQVKPGGDVALLKGLMKLIFERDEQAVSEGRSSVLDQDFIIEHTLGIDALRADAAETDWSFIYQKSGLAPNEFESAVDAYLRAERVIICYGMGITQHATGTEIVQQLANLLMLRGNIGKQGAGLCPLRGHSNVQGDRTVGITEIPNAALLDGMEAAFGFRPPSEKGHNAVEAIEAIRLGKSKALICLGGNLAVAMSDPDVTFPAMRKLDLAVHLATKPNRSHLLTARTTILLPVLGRTDRDVQEAGVQSVTVEDSMSMIHASKGFLEPPSKELKSEPAIIAGMAKATLGDRYDIDWDGLVADYDRIREKIEVVFPDFHDFNIRVRKPGGFRLDIPASRREWSTPSGKANFIVARNYADPRMNVAGALVLTTLRSHGQYNTTIYNLDDRYRGVFGRRDVLMMNKSDMGSRGISHGDRVVITSIAENDVDEQKIIEGFIAIEYNIPVGSVAGYYPEMNRVIALSDFDPQSGTPSYKGVPVTVRSMSTSANVSA